MDPLILLVIGLVVVTCGIVVLRLHAFLALVAAALIVGGLTPRDTIRDYGIASGMSEAGANKLAETAVGKRVAESFGKTCAKVGILVAMAAIIGKCLLETGAADRIVRSALKLVGETKAPFAFMSSSFLLAVPVFFDSVFYLMMPLAKSITLRTGRNYILYTLAIVAGATMAHSLIPPTPGPLVVAEEFDVSFMDMMKFGFVIGGLSVLTGYAYAVWFNRHHPIPLRQTDTTTVEELKAVTTRDESILPSLWASLFPILLPVALIAIGSFLSNQFEDETASGLVTLFITLGDKNLALTLAAAASLLLVYRHFNQDRSTLKTVVDGALTSAAAIILITSAGGALGGILQQTGITFRIEALASQYKIGVLPLAFFVTALVRTAQGSATVAMITASGVLAGFGDPQNLGFHPAYIAMAIGCGSKLIPWMNDSGFWVIGRLSGMTETETLKSFSVLLTLMGFAGLIFTMVFATLLPKGLF